MRFKSGWDELVRIPPFPPRHKKRSFERINKDCGRIVAKRLNNSRKTALTGLKTK